MRMRAGPANPDRDAQHRGQDAAWFRPKYECWIAVPTCPFTFDLFDLRPVAMITGRITFYRPLPRQRAGLHNLARDYPIKMYMWRHGACGKGFFIHILLNSRPKFAKSSIYEPEKFSRIHNSVVLQKQERAASSQGFMYHAQYFRKKHGRLLLSLSRKLSDGKRQVWWTELKLHEVVLYACLIRWHV